MRYTTATIQLLANEWGTGSLYINPDNIAMEEFGDWNDDEAIRKAAVRATEIRYACLEAKRDFVFTSKYKRSYSQC